MSKPLYFKTEMFSACEYSIVGLKQERALVRFNFWKMEDSCIREMGHPIEVSMGSIYTCSDDMSTGPPICPCKGRAHIT